MLVWNNSRASYAASEIFSYLASSTVALCNRLLDWPNGSDPDDADTLHTVWEKEARDEPRGGPTRFGDLGEQRNLVSLNKEDFEGKQAMKVFAEN